MPTGYFEAYPAADLPTLVSVAVSDLIAGDTSGLRTPLYGPWECPEPNFIRAADYLPNVGPLYRIPLYSSRSFAMSPYTRAASDITAAPPAP